ncbi:MAG TPA: PEP-CTERM sorting domain-containing protein [Nitrospiraceae bacterium]|nr:PEP-CTERM sorting domain-containing protein [Nitrospiraceae bacterium]
MRGVIDSRFTGWVSIIGFYLMFSVTGSMAETLTITSGFVSEVQDLPPQVSISGPGFSISQVPAGDCCGHIMVVFGVLPVGTIQNLSTVLFLGGVLQVNGQQYEPANSGPGINNALSVTAPAVPIFETSTAPFVLSGTIAAVPRGHPSGPVTNFDVVGAGTETVTSLVAMADSPSGQQTLAFYQAIRLDFAAIPEPSTWALLFSGLLALGGYRLVRRACYGGNASI